jgi:hypothetical protein
METTRRLDREKMTKKRMHQWSWARSVLYLSAWNTVHSDNAPHVLHMVMTIINYIREGQHRLCSYAANVEVRNAPHFWKKTHCRHVPRKYTVFHKELCNGIPNVTVWRVLAERLHLKVYKLSIIQHLQGWAG